MTISLLLMLLAFNVAGSNQSIGGESTTNQIRLKIIGHCYVNGVLVNPCPPANPEPPPPQPDPGPEIQQ